MIPACHLKQRLDTGPGTPRAHARQTCRHQNAVVAIQRHHVGHRTQGHQIQRIGKIGYGNAALSKPVSASEFGAQRTQHVKHHPDPGQRFAGKAAARLIGIDDDIGRW